MYLSAFPRDRPATGKFPVEDREWPITRPMIVGERSWERGTEREWKQRERMNRIQVGTLDQFQIPHKRKGQLMADVGPNVM